MSRFSLRPWLIAVVLGAGLTFALPADAGAGGACRGIPVTVKPGTAVAIDQLCFSPTILEVEAGQTVTWTNEDDAPHAVTGANASWGDYAELGRGDSLSHTFDAPGVYPYYCIYHAGMVGAVVVTGETEARTSVLAQDTSDSGRGFPAAGYALAGAFAGVVVAGSGLALLRRR